MAETDVDGAVKASTANKARPRKNDAMWGKVVLQLGDDLISLNPTELDY